MEPISPLSSSIPVWRLSAVSAFHSSTPEEETLLAAKMVGRWQSGAPLTLAPDRDDPALGADPLRNNAYLYMADDAKGFVARPARMLVA